MRRDGFGAMVDVVAFGAHPDDLEAVGGGVAATLVKNGRAVLFVDPCDGEPARHTARGIRQSQAGRAWRWDLPGNPTAKGMEP